MSDEKRGGAGNYLAWGIGLLVLAGVIAHDLFEDSGWPWSDSMADERPAGAAATGGGENASVAGGATAEAPAPQLNHETPTTFIPVAGTWGMGDQVFEYDWSKVPRVPVEVDKGTPPEPLPTGTGLAGGASAPEVVASTAQAAAREPRPVAAPEPVAAAPVEKLPEAVTPAPAPETARSAAATPVIYPGFTPYPPPPYWGARPGYPPPYYPGR